MDSRKKPKVGPTQTKLCLTPTENNLALKYVTQLFGQGQVTSR